MSVTTLRVLYAPRDVLTALDVARVHFVKHPPTTEVALVLNALIKEAIREREVEAGTRCPWSKPHYGQPCDCAELLAAVTQHTTTPHPDGPVFCAYCSEAIQEWVPADDPKHLALIAQDPGTTAALATVRDQADDGLAGRVAALLPVCYITRNEAMPCTDWIGSEFGNGIWLEAMCCLPCQVRALVDLGQRP